MKYRALVTAEVIPSMLDALKDNVDFDFDGYYIDHEVMPVDELKSKIKEYDIARTRFMSSSCPSVTRFEPVSSITHD